MRTERLQFTGSLSLIDFAHGFTFIKRLRPSRTHRHNENDQPLSSK